jgi:hypothetical protein
MTELALHVAAQVIPHVPVRPAAATTAVGSRNSVGRVRWNSVRDNNRDPRAGAFRSEGRPKLRFALPIKQYNGLHRIGMHFSGCRMAIP